MKPNPIITIVSGLFTVWLSSVIGFWPTMAICFVLLFLMIGYTYSLTK